MEIVNSMLVLMNVVKEHQGVRKPTMKLPLLLKANNIWVPTIQETTTNTGQIQQSYRLNAVIT